MAADMGGSLVSLLGGFRPGGLDRARALDRQMGAQMLPYNQAIGDARRGAFSAAHTAAQSSGNPFLAQREAVEAGSRAAAPLLAQRAQAQASMVSQEIAREEQRRAAEGQRFERMLGAGLSAGAGGLATLLQGFGGGGGQAGGTTSGLPGATMTGSTTAGPSALSGILSRHPAGGAQGAPQGGPPQGGPPQGAPPTPQPSSLSGQQQSQATGAGLGTAAPLAVGESEEERRRRAGLGGMLGQGGSAISSLFPGYGSLVGAGMGMLGGAIG